MKQTMRPLSQALSGALAELLRDVPTCDGKVDVAWKAAVGSAVERVSSVRLDHGILFVDVPDSNWDREIARSAPVILARMRALLGRDAVSALQIRTRT
jgi:hypothetical protein